MARWLGGLPETSPVGGKLLHVAAARWLGVHANGLLFTCLPSRPGGSSMWVCAVCVCALCVACMRVVAVGNCMLLVLAAYTIPSTDTETIFYFYSFHTKFARSDGLFTNNQRGHTTHPPLTTHQQGMLPHLAPAPHTQSCSPPSLQSNRCLIRC